MLPKANRIRKKKDFEIIFKNSKGFKGDCFILRVAKNNLGQNRFGFVVSQKVSKKATTRNKIKRRLSEAVKTEIKNVKTGTDLVLIALPGIKNKNYNGIKETLNKALIKFKLTIKN